MQGKLTMNLGFWEIAKLGFAISSYVLANFWLLGSLYCTVLLAAIVFIKERRTTYLFKGIGFFIPFVLLIIVKSMFMGTLIEDLHSLGLLLLFPFVALTFSFFSSPTRSLVISAISYSGVLLLVISVINIILFINEFPGRYQGFSHYGYENEALGFERPFLALQLVISSLFLSQQKIYPILKYVLLLLFLVFVIFISARLATVFIGLLLLFEVLRSKVIVIRYVTIAAVILLFSVLGSSVMNRIVKITEGERVFLWNNAHELIKKEGDFSIVFGSCENSFSTLRDDFSVICSENAKNQIFREFYSRKKKGFHNQFLTIYYVSGILGVVLFGLGLLLISRSEINSSYIIALLLFLMYLLIEDILLKQNGSYLMGVLLGLNINRKE